MRAFVGTSGFSYAQWKGTFYPDKLPGAKMLGHYAGKLPAVEINNTFYRMPKAELLTRWAAETPDTFRFALKAPQRITHKKRLVDAADDVAFFADASRALGDQRGPALFQLPPFLRKDIPRLRDFLAALREKAPDLRATFEFRHDSWWDPETYKTLADGGAALCLSESETMTTPIEITNPTWGYLRLRREDYDEPALRTWAARIAAQPWQETFVFFKHEDAGVGPRLAARMIELLANPGA